MTATDPRAEHIRHLGDEDLAQLVNRLDAPLMLALRAGITNAAVEDLRDVAAFARIEHRRRQAEAALEAALALLPEQAVNVA